MSEISQFLIKHGVPFLFAAIFVEQMGAPLPALPWLLAVGALSAAGKFNPVLGVCVTVLACAPADAFWFYLGRHRGNQVLRFLCRITLEPDSCVRRTQNIFVRYGMRGVMAAKFLPGFGTMIAPLAGMHGFNAARFLLLDAIGSLAYGVCYIGLGYVFGNQIEQIAGALAHVGGSAFGLLIGLVASYIGFKYWRRRRLLRELRMARITVAELRQKQAAGENLYILDLRSREELEQEPSLIDGAIHVEANDVETRHLEIPRDRDVILYCSCPNEITSARVALMLHRRGITRVRPLLGGIDAWRESNRPLETLNKTEASDGQ
jgi:membrane protein DedA with SNARE-associated domain/rhodanese-related sulfurtransferase